MQIKYTFLKGHFLSGSSAALLSSFALSFNREAARPPYINEVKRW